MHEIILTGDLDRKGETRYWFSKFDSAVGDILVDSEAMRSYVFSSAANWKFSGLLINEGE